MLMSLSGSLGLNAQTNTKEAYYAVEIDFKEYDEDFQEWMYWGVNVTFYYDNLRSSRGETYLLPQNGGKLNIPNSVSYVAIFFNNSFADYRPTNTSYWFSEINAETCVNFYGENLNTSAVTNMSHMFYRLCGDDGIIGSFDLSHFDLSNVTDMSYMFAELGNMENGLDISALDFRTSINTTKLLEDAKIEKLTVSATANNLASDAFTGMGNAKYPRTLECTTNFTLEGATQYDGYVKWKGGYFNVNGLEPYAELSSDNTTLTFYYDTERSSRTGTTYDINMENSNPGWYKYDSPVTSVVFAPSFADVRPTTCYKWFAEMRHLQSVTGLSYLKTDEVTNMNNMFYKCSSLTSLNLSGLNTAKVTNMDGMFEDCSNLQSLDLSGFNTAKVTTMQGMFHNCSNLQSLDLSGFNTANVTEMHYMFYKCSSLQSLNLSGFNTANVTNMNYMFHMCSSLTGLDLSGFNTANVTEMKYMLYQCSSLTSLDLSSFTIPSSSSSMMENCSSLQTLTIPASATALNANACNGVGTQATPCTLIYPDGFTFTPTSTGDGWYKWKSGYFKDGPKPYAVLSWDKTTLTFYCDTESTSRIGSIYDMNTGNNVPRWYNSRTNVTTVVFDPSFANARPSSCFSWFAMPHLNSITGLEYLNTSAVTDMEQMFTGCPLESIDVSHFNTANVTTMDGMFYGCANLKSIDVSGFNTNKMNDPDTGIISMFTSCTSLTSLDLSSFTFYTVANTASMLSNCTSLQKLTIPATAKELNANACSGVGTQDAPCTLVYPEGFTPEKTATGDGWYQWKRGFFKDAVDEPYAVLSPSDTTLTFYYDKQKGLRPGTSYDLNKGDVEPGWNRHCYNVTTVVFDASFCDARPTTCYMWFDFLPNLTTFEHLDYLNTSEVTDMSYMFQNCQSLKSIDVSTFNTEKVTRMQYMFNGCTSLETLQGLSSFNTANVMYMIAMFQNCSSLTELKGVNSFNMDKVLSNDYMFKNCSSLKRLLLGHFRIPNRNDEMMAGCTSLQTLFIIPSGDELDSGACTGVGTKKAPCTLVTEDPSTITHDESYDGYFKWKGGYFKDAVDEPYAAFAGSTLTFLYDKWRTIAENEDETFDLEPRLGIPKWLAKANDIKYVVFTPSFAEARPTSCASWFYNMTQLVGIINLSYLNTSEVTNMFYMFGNCKMLKSLNVSSFNTANVTNMEGMFNGCSGLTSINVSGLNTANVTTMETMFYGCSSLTSLDVSGLNTANVKRMQNMFYKCSSLTSLDVSGFNTEKVINMSGMFSYCSNLTSVNVSGFNTQNTTYMSGMFNNCTSLTSLDLSSFTIPLNGYWSTMMKNCTSLQTLTVPATAGNMPASACTNVGTQSAPCTLIYPYGFTPEKEEEGDGWYKWKDGYFKDGTQYSPYLMGDVNHDGFLSIVDVTLLVDHVLGNNPPNFFIENADVTGDGIISISDITRLVDILLNQ